VLGPPAFAAVGGLALVGWVVVPARPWRTGQLATAANGLTALRLAAVLALPLVAPRLGDLTLAGVAGALFVFDGVDGVVARWRGTVSRFGAVLDAETDALFVMTLCLLLHDRGVVGGWVLVAGLWRYGYGALVALVPSRGEAPRSSLGRLVAGALMLSLAASFLLGAGRAWPAAALGTALVSYSFLRGIAWSYRRGSAQSNSTSGPSDTWRQSSAIASDS
jgi:phosphatidylglycerophosphate synthase